MAEFEDRMRALENRLARVDVYEQALQEAIDRAVTAVTERADRLEARVAGMVDRAAIVAEFRRQIHQDAELRELLRGRPGLPGTDGKPGPPGDPGLTVIRERSIVG